MKADKFRSMDAGELERQVQDAQEQLFRFRFQMGMGQSEGLKKYRVLKKDRARMLTVRNETGTHKSVEGAAPASKPAASGKKKK